MFVSVLGERVCIFRVIRWGVAIHIPLTVKNFETSLIFGVILDMHKKTVNQPNPKSEVVNDCYCRNPLGICKNRWLETS